MENNFAVPARKMTKNRKRFRAEILNQPTKKTTIKFLTNCKGPTAGVTGKGGIWRTEPPDAESAVGARIPKVWANARTCPVHAVLGLPKNAHETWQTLPITPDTFELEMN